MKKYFFLTAVFCAAIVMSSHAQQNKLTPPQAKNYHPSKDTKPAATVMVKTYTPKRNPPQAKNRRPGEDPGDTQPITFLKRKRLTPPAAKNTPISEL
jgi:hypothetical protein